jgi:uncharacterized protein (DUF697 family)
MTPKHQSLCRRIIHSAAVTAGAGNLVPIPGFGIAVDLVTMTGMTIALANVFGGSIPKAVAEGLSIAALKETALKQPVKTITKELSRFIPLIGLLIAPTISIGMIEAAGWNIARQMDRDFGNK